MNLRRFALHRPGSLPDAIALLAQLGEDAALLAGGTELLLAMKMGVAHWPHLVDLKRVPELQGISLQHGLLRVGAGATHMEVERDQLVRDSIPALAELEGNVANVRVRAAGTLAGNLCFGEPHADPPALLVALGAQVELSGPRGTRRLPVAEFLTGAYENALSPDEVLVAVEVPVPGPGVRAAYLNFRTLERPSAGVAVVGRVAAGRFEGMPHVVVGAADEVPRPVEANMLDGAGTGDSEAFGALAQAAAEAVEPVDDLSGSAEYKKHLVGVLAKRAALRALAAA